MPVGGAVVRATDAFGRLVCFVCCARVGCFVRVVIGVGPQRAALETGEGRRGALGREVGVGVGGRVVRAVPAAARILVAQFGGEAGLRYPAGQRRQSAAPVGGVVRGGAGVAAGGTRPGCGRARGRRPGRPYGAHRPGAPDGSPAAAEAVADRPAAAPGAAWPVSVPVPVTLPVSMAGPAGSAESRAVGAATQGARAPFAAAPVPSAPPAGSRTTMSCGISTIAVVPPYGEGRSVTVMPCRCARRATTNMPSRRSSASATTSNCGATASWALNDA